jgi:RNA polymerase sigma-70 factor (ECF subfamily)
VEEATEISKAQPESREWEDELRRYMVRYQAGDGASVEKLVHRLSVSLFSYFMTPQLSLSDVEDLVQECWLRIHRSRNTYRATEPLLPWIFAIARHTMLDDRRRRRRRAAREVLLGEPPDLAGHITATSSHAPDVVRLLERLPANDRDLLMLLKVTGMTMKEAARATSSSVAATKQRAHRAYARLRAFLAAGD